MLYGVNCILFAQYKFTSPNRNLRSTRSVGLTVCAVAGWDSRILLRTVCLADLWANNLYMQPHIFRENALLSRSQMTAIYIWMSVLRFEYRNRFFCRLINNAFSTETVQRQIVGRLMNHNWKGFRKKRRCLNEVGLLSWHFLRETEENH